MNSLFSPRQKNNANQEQMVKPQVQNEDETLNYVEEMLRRSGGDAKAAFYLAAKEKGVDPEQFLGKVRSYKDLKSIAQTLFMKNPRIKSLMSLFSMMK